MVVTPEFWRNRRVFITGHTGFKGSWLAMLLHSMSASVTGYALNETAQRSLFELAQVSKTMRSVTGDVRDLASLRTAIQDAKPEIVFHLAAQSLVRLSYSDPDGTFSTNVGGTVNLLEACRDVSALRAVVIVTSDKCYEENEARLPYKENAPLGGHDPYSASKACAEIVTSAYRRSFFGAANSLIAVASARAGNVIGGGDWALDRLIPDLVGAFSAGLQPRIRNPNATRPWQHVLDPLAGYLVLAERLHIEGQRFAEAWNFGPASGSTTKVQTVANRVAQLWGSGAAWSADVDAQPREAPMLSLDSAKAQQQLGWYPQLALDSALEWTVSWYKNLHQGGDAQQLVREQIRCFMKGALR